MRAIFLDDDIPHPLIPPSNDFFLCKNLVSEGVDTLYDQMDVSNLAKAWSPIYYKNHANEGLIEVLNISN